MEILDKIDSYLVKCNYFSTTYNREGVDRICKEMALMPVIVEHSNNCCNVIMDEI